MTLNRSKLLFGLIRNYQLGYSRGKFRDLPNFTMIIFKGTFTKLRTSDLVRIEASRRFSLGFEGGFMYLVGEVMGLELTCQKVG